MRRATLVTFNCSGTYGSGASTAEDQKQSQSQGSRMAVRSVQWFRDGQRLLAAGDDGMVRVFSLRGVNSTTPLRALSGHGDVVRAAALWQQPAAQSSSLSASSLFPKIVAATGSYDHTIRLWDLNSTDDGKIGEDNNSADRCWAVLGHGAPVQCLLWMRSLSTDDDRTSRGTKTVSSKSPQQQQRPPCWLISAGGTALKVWNPVTGQCTCTMTAHHRKTITCLVASTRIHEQQQSGGGGTVSLSLPRILTASLDGWIRIHAFEAATGFLSPGLHGVRVEGHTAITALAIDNSDHCRLAIGTADGKVLVRQRGFAKTQHKRQREPKAGTFAYFTRGQNASLPSFSSQDTTIVAEQQQGKKRKLRPFDVALKQFRYSDALDEALETRMPRVGKQLETTGL